MTGEQYSTFHYLVGLRVTVVRHTLTDFSEAWLAHDIPSKDYSSLNISLLEEYLHLSTCERRIRPDGEREGKPAALAARRFPRQDEPILIAFEEVELSLEIPTSSLDIFLQFVELHQTECCTQL